LIIINLYYPSPKDPPYPIEEVRKEKVLHPTCVDHHANGWIRYAPDLMIRPVARIVRELPPSPCDWWWWLVLNSSLPTVLKYRLDIGTHDYCCVSAYASTIINHTVAYRVRFPSAPPRLGCLLSCGVRV